MNKTSKYILFTLLTTFMVTACTLEGGIKEVREKAGIEDYYNSPDTGTRPNTPEAVSAEAESSDSITISWDYEGDEWVELFEVYRSTSASGSYVLIAEVDGEDYSCTDTGLSANTTYYYRVAAVNGYGKSARSSYASATTLSSSGNGTLSAPTGVTATAESSSTITIDWYPVSGAVGYYVYRSTSASGTYGKITTLHDDFYTDTGLSANTTYYYKVSAVNSYAEEGPQSAYASATTLSSSSGNEQPPSAPTGLYVKQYSSSFITIIWNPVPGATLYDVYRSTSASGYYDIIGATDTTTYTDTGLSANTTYYYKVSAWNSGEESPQSAYTSQKTLPSF